MNLCPTHVAIGLGPFYPEIQVSRRPRFSKNNGLNFSDGGPRLDGINLAIMAADGYCFTKHTPASVPPDGLATST